MAGNDVSIRIGASFVGKKAFKEADSAAAKLTGTVKKLAGGLGLALGARQIAIYGKNAVKAFAADEKAARSLTLTLNNLGLAFADPEVKNFISSLESQFGVLDDLLRPAYQKLLTTTGDYKKAQDLLKTSLDLAAMSGQDVVSVAGDLARAYAGNTRSLQKYGLGLSKAELTAMSFEDILKQIAIVSEGQAAAAADSYSGALDRLTVAAANASESIGKDLLTALDTLSGGNGLPKTINLIESLASGVGDAVIGFSRLIRNIGILASGNPIESLRDLRKATEADKAMDRRDRAQYGGIYATQYQATAAASSKSLARTQLNTQKALTKAQQDALKLAKAKAVFDLQKIQIEAALKGKISEEDRLRLKLMKAIEEENIDATEKLQKQLETAQTKTKELSELLTTIKTLEIKDPFGTWKIDPLTAAINELTKSIGGVGTQIQASGREWSSFANSVANTVIRPNLSEWSSSFSAAAAATKTASESITAAQAASSAAIAKVTLDTTSALQKLKDDTAASIAAQTKATQDAIVASSVTGTNVSTLELLKTAEAAAASTTTNAPIEITVNTGIGDPNAIAEAIQDVLFNANARGTITNAILGIA